MATVAAALCALPAAAVPTGPGIFRAYLSGTGNDANPCTLQLPCRLLPAALAAVQQGGEVWMLDSANYNTAPVGITKSVTILAIPGELGSVVGNGGDALDISTASVTVVLRNLNIQNLTAGSSGVNITNGSRVTLQGCNVTGFQDGVYVSAANTKVEVLDSVVRDNGNGVSVRNGTVVISRSHIDQNGYGVSASPIAAGVTATAHIYDSTASQNSQTGVSSSANQGTARIYAERTVASNNVLDGFQSATGGGGPDSEVSVSRSVASGNGRYGFGTFGATFRSAGDNLVFDNASADTNVAPTVLTLR
jgi:hypothetical protein